MPEAAAAAQRSSASMDSQGQSLPGQKTFKTSMLGTKTTSGKPLDWKLRDGGYQCSDDFVYFIATLSEIRACKAKWASKVATMVAMEFAHILDFAGGLQHSPHIYDQKQLLHLCCPELYNAVGSEKFGTVLHTAWKNLTKTRFMQMNGTLDTALWIGTAKKPSPKEKSTSHATPTSSSLNNTTHKPTGSTLHSPPSGEKLQVARSRLFAS